MSQRDTTICADDGRAYVANCGRDPRGRAFVARLTTRNIILAQQRAALTRAIAQHLVAVEVGDRVDETRAELARLITEQRVDATVPLPLQLLCPECGRRHIDRDEWATRPHKTHRCERCRFEWRPFEFATVGVDNHKEVPDAARNAGGCT